jgi:alpha-methylacyl-CoA racemase
MSFSLNREERPMEDGSGPLTGVSIVEMAAIGPAPFAAMMLADMGARVVRIDRVPRAGAATVDLYEGSRVLDRGRRSISLNLKDPRSAAIVLQLLKSTDILLEGYRPGVMERMGLGPEVCLQANPKLIYGRVTGWGQSGPLAHTAGHDLNYMAISGALYGMGGGGEPPFPPLNLVADYGAGGMMLALGVVSALHEVRRSNRGQVVDAAMSDGCATMMSLMYDLKSRGLWNVERQSNVTDGSAPFYAVYECADGKFLSVAAIEPQFFGILLANCPLPGVALSDQWDRGRWPDMQLAFGAAFRKRTRDEWCALFVDTDGCVAPVLDMNEAPEYHHNRARSTFVDVAGVVQPAPSPRFSRTPSGMQAAPPKIGEHTAEVLQGIGLGVDEIEDLQAGGAVYVDR